MAQRPAAGAPIRAEARDTILQNAASETLGAGHGRVHGGADTWLETVKRSIS